MLGVIVNLGVKAGFYGCADSSFLRAELCYVNASSSWWQEEEEQTNGPQKGSGAEMLSGRSWIVAVSFHIAL